MERGFESGNRLTRALLIVASLLLVFEPAFRPTAMSSSSLPERWAKQAQREISIAISKDSFWYTTHSTAKIFLTVTNHSREKIRDIAVRLKSHSRITSRPSLDHIWGEKPFRYYRSIEYVKSQITLSPGNNSFIFEIDIHKRGFRTGIYPLTIEILRGGNVASSGKTALVVLEEESLESFHPLRLVTVFDILKPPQRNPDGSFSSSLLARECSPDDWERGWIPALLSSVENRSESRLTISFSPLLLEEINAISKGFTIRGTGRGGRMPGDSALAEGARSTIERLRNLVSENRVQLLLTPYACPNLESMCNVGWQSDSREQISLGLRTLKNILGFEPDSRFFFPPALLFNSKAARQLGDGVCDFTVLTPALLGRSETLKRFAERAKAGALCTLDAGSKKIGAFFADGRLLGVVEKFGGSRDAHGFTQIIIAELAVCYLQQPSTRGTCVFVWNCRRSPSPETVKKLVEALADVPWLEMITMGEAVRSSERYEDRTLTIPPRLWPEESSYFPVVGRARETLASFRHAVQGEVPLIFELRKRLFAAQSDTWRQWGMFSSGEVYAESIVSEIGRETSKVSIQQSSMISLAGRSSRIPLTIWNRTGYRLKPRITLSCNALEFPEGETKTVTLEPKENLVEVPAKVRKTGKAILHVVIGSQDLVFAEARIPVQTGKYSLFAIVFIGGMLFLIGLASTVRILARRKVGKHKQKKRKRKKP